MSGDSLDEAIDKELLSIPSSQLHHPTEYGTGIPDVSKAFCDLKDGHGSGMMTVTFEENEEQTSTTPSLDNATLTIKVETKTGNEETKEDVKPYAHKGHTKARGVADGEIWIAEDIMIYKNHPLSSTHVYRGYQSFLEGRVRKEIAVKIFHIDEQDSDWSRRYFKEVKNMIKLESHSNVVQFVRCGRVVDNKLGGFYIAMSLCHEKTLADIDVESLNIEERKNIFLQVCEGVKHLHNCKIAHLDIKPSNILFSLAGEKVVISDFGISREVEISKNSGKTTIQHSSTRFGGTQGWMAGEMLRTRGKPATVPNFCKADIFSLGLVGHCIFTGGCHPFGNKDYPNHASFREVDIIKKVSPDFNCLWPRTDGYIASNLFERMLSHNPEKRPTIKQVLSHFLFWNCSKRIQFFVDMYEGYFHGKSGCCFPEDATQEQKLLHESLSTKREETFRSVSQEKTNGKKGKREIIDEMSEVAGCWMQKVEKAQPGILGRHEKGCSCSMQELIRFIRNYHVHNIQKSEEGTENTWELFSRLFPRLLPYIYEVMEPAFSKSHQKEYKLKMASASDIDFKHVLLKSENGVAGGK